MTASFNLKQLSATDVLVPATMKNAAKCDKQCELQNSVNHQIFERILRPRENWGHACFSVLNEPHYHIFRGVQSVETEYQTSYRVCCFKYMAWGHTQIPLRSVVVTLRVNLTATGL